MKVDLRGDRYNNNERLIFEFTQEEVRHLFYDLQNIVMKKFKNETTYQFLDYLYMN